ncbi:GPI-ANCHORED ADHESIN-LIKE PROTEIN [Salix purpurea]|uniref:GPI-ANCHORED ADHESIN-LIKE PROTEIN n=1 Tax=Salix purpurea TaxID=77065 RepID=A0A9Q0WYZ2_SALPP|nr:GPI-ANCHORED ADHESIN-LIKE PROTEIN [Salix purpurea]
MEGERKRSKGSLFNLFDWNGKSRKKLFASNSELPEGLKQGKENVEKMEKRPRQVVELDDRRANLSNRGSSDFSCASSMTSDEGYGTRAPGAVARLMGLDSLPTSNVASTLGFDSHSLRAFQYDSSTPNLWSEYDPMGYLKVPNKQEKYAWNSVELRPHKVENRPSKRFQTETLPPKSAKSIPATHHKLLSPIKNPGFTPTKNVAYIMEAAAKIIEANPKATSSGKVPSIGTSSVPLRIRDLKQKMEAAAHTTSKPQRSSESCVSKNTKGQQSDKSQSGPEDLSSSKTSMSSERGTPTSLKNKGKSVPLAVQAKSTNGQRRDGSTLRSKSTVKQKEQNEVKANQMLKTQPCTQNTVQKRIAESRTSNVLQQNNLKQNSVPNKDNSAVKNSVSNQQGRKTKSTNGSVGQNRTVNKVVVKPETVPRKMGLVMTDSEKEKTKNIARKRRSVSGDFQIDRNATPNVSLNKDEMPTKTNVVMDGNMNMAMDDRKSGMDIVSFTFSSPIKRAAPSSQSSGQMSDKCSSSAIDSLGSKDYPSKSSTSFFPGLNGMGGDVLGVLLEQKLRELTNKIESSHCNVIREETSATSLSIFQNSLSTPNVASTSSAALDKMLQIVHDKDKSDSLGYFDCILVENSQLAMNQKYQHSEEMEVQSSSSNYSETGKEIKCQRTSPVSILEPSFASGSCSYLNGSSHCSTNESVGMEVETELSDSASSISTMDVVRKYTTRTCSMTKSKESSDWELDFMRDILLENQDRGMENNEEDYSKLARKLLFDCVSESLDYKCGRILSGSSKAWARLSTLFQRKGWLAEELYKEILGWQSMGDMMVDELVDQDMSTQTGKWLEFSIETFEEGLEIEDGILTSLVDELVSELYPC